MENSHVLAVEKPDLVVAGFPYQGFSRASGQARGLANPRTHQFTEALRVMSPFDSSTSRSLWVAH